MKKLVQIFLRPIRALSPEVEDHFKYLLIELYCCFIHFKSKGTAKQFRGKRGLRVNFGCGPALKAGFVNVDFSRHAEIRMDLRRAIPLDDNSCVEVFSEHFVEHLSYPEGAHFFLSECQRVLEDGGKILLSVPDSEWPLREYGTDEDSYLKACEAHGWHPEGCTTMLEHINYHFRQRAPGRSPSGFGVHRFAWDFETLRKALEFCGFKEVERRDFDPNLDAEHRRIGSLMVSAVSSKSAAS